MCDNPETHRAAFGALVHYRVFKYILSVALTGLATDGRRPPDALFMLDLSDRADVRTAGDVPKLAASSGACSASIPVPISLKGLGHNILASRWYTGAPTPWPSVPWHQKKRRAVWRGQFRSYSECLGVRPGFGSGSGGGGSGCALRACEASCYGAPSSHAARLLLELARTECSQCACADSGAPPHPRAVAVRLGRSGLPLDASFSPCNPAHGDCAVATVHTAAQSAAQKRLGRLPFSQQANYSAVLELDGFGWQASLLSKLGLGSAVITQASLYPLWFDTLLQSGVHVLRVSGECGLGVHVHVFTCVQRLSLPAPH